MLGKIDKNSLDFDQEVRKLIDLLIDLEGDGRKSVTKPYNKHSQDARSHTYDVRSHQRGQASTANGNLNKDPHITKQSPNFTKIKCYACQEFGHKR